MHLAVVFVMIVIVIVVAVLVLVGVVRPIGVFVLVLMRLVGRVIHPAAFGPVRTNTVRS
jgi:hypothetical protein